MSARHVMILASAGAGKTYALTNRYVRLLAHGAAPERIVALTFTRKAAGEFFDEILKKLARAARESQYAADLGREIGRPEMGAGDFGRLLREMIDAMHRLRLGTLDGFFARIARAFPLELGLSGEFELLQEHAARVERQRVLQRIFARRAGQLDAAQREFVEAFKRATFGAEEKQMGARLDAFLDEHQETFLAASGRQWWGDPARIWPDGCAWLGPEEKPLREAVAALRDLFKRRGLGDKQQARWEMFFAALPEWSAGAPLPAPVEYVLKNALTVWSELQRGAAEMVVERKKFALGPQECAELRTIIKHVVCSELTRRLETTRGIHAVLRAYEAVYHDLVRRAGRLTFSDVQRLLRPETAQRSLGSTAGAPGEAERMLIDFRLDGQFDHWLLDEFQDTSFGQWSVLRNLIDEVVQDPMGERSFFCVGDVKQAIFTWREGDPRLFREIFDHYNSVAPGTLAEEHLVKSWRSGPPIIEMVNAVFSRGEALAELFPGPASEMWSREWRAHESARPALAGQAAWLHAVDEEERFALVARLLREIAPLERGLECAVLTQTNATAAALADYLRRVGGMPALAESDLRVCTDNPLGAALLALAQAAAFPGDTLAQEHWRMTPLVAALAAEGITAPEVLTLRLLEQIHADGFEQAMEFWLRRIEPKLAPSDAFSRERGRQFLAAAGLFDETGSRDVAGFVAFMQRHTMREAETGGVVRVMTIHKSKGLGFDVVVLPDLEGQRLDQRRAGLAVQRGSDRSVRWVLELPPKLFHGQDETLAAHVRNAEAEACYEALSLLYVAMTRAKRAMYVITKPAGTSESRNYPKLLGSTLGGESGEVRVGGSRFAGGWASGDPGWHLAVTLPKEAQAAGPELPLVINAPRAPRRRARRPSGERAGNISATQIFGFSGGEAAQFGTAVHALLADVEWSDSEATERAAATWREKGPEGAVALACLRAPALGEVWRRRGGAEVWRERSFEIVLDGVWLSGVFDRVIVEREADRVRAVTVFDFKTDRIADEAALRAAVARHSPQLNEYRRIAAVLAQVPTSVVRCELVFTQTQRRVEAPS